MKVLVNYICWGCGSITQIEEEIELESPVQEIDQWNICPECQKKQETKKEK